MDEKKIPELKNSNKKLVLIIVLAVLAVALIVLAVVNSSNKGKNNGAATSGTDQSATTQTGNNSAPTSGEAAPTNTTNPTGSENATATAPTPDAAVNGATPNAVDGTAPVKEAPIEKTEPITIKMSIDASKGFNPASIDVKAGQQVTLNVTSNGGVAILVFDGGISATAIGISDGQTKDASFTAPTTRGSYSVHNDIPGRNQSCKINVK